MLSWRMLASSSLLLRVYSSKPGLSDTSFRKASLGVPKSPSSSRQF